MVICYRIAVRSENMGLLKKMVTKAAVRTAGNAVKFGTVKHMENTRSIETLTNKSVAKYVLHIKQKTMAIKRNFVVYDQSDNKKYSIKTDSLTFGYPCIRLYNNNDREIGYATLSDKMGMGTYTIHLNGMGETISRKVSAKIKFNIGFKGWHLDGNLMQNSFTVVDKNDALVMKFDSAFSIPDAYVLELYDKKNEELGLLLIMVVELILHGNK